MFSRIENVNYLCVALVLHDEINEIPEICRSIFYLGLVGRQFLKQSRLEIVDLIHKPYKRIGQLVLGEPRLVFLLSAKFVDKGLYRVVHCTATFARVDVNSVLFAK